jgi:hypothetical protein
VQRVKQDALKVEGLNAALRTFRKLPRECSDSLRDASMKIADKVANDARGRAGSRLQRMAAESVAVKRDRIPAIKSGGGKRHGRNRRGTYGAVFFGAEFGGGARPSTRQFPAHRGTKGYFLWPAVRDNSKYIAQAYGDALVVAMDRAGAR